MDFLFDLPQPKAHYIPTGYCVMPKKINEPFNFQFRNSPARVIWTTGIRMGKKTFGVEYGPDYKWFISLTEDELRDAIA